MRCTHFVETEVNGMYLYIMSWSNLVLLSCVHHVCILNSCVFVICDVFCRQMSNMNVEVEVLRVAHPRLTVWFPNFNVPHNASSKDKHLFFKHLFLFKRKYNCS